MEFVENNFKKILIISFTFFILALITFLMLFGFSFLYKNNSNVSSQFITYTCSDDIEFKIEYMEQVVGENEVYEAFDILETSEPSKESNDDIKYTYYNFSINFNISLDISWGENSGRIFEYDFVPSLEGIDDDQIISSGDDGEKIYEYMPEHNFLDDGENEYLYNGNSEISYKEVKWSDENSGKEIELDEIEKIFSENSPLISTSSYYEKKDYDLFENVEINDYYQFILLTDLVGNQYYFDYSID